jgi:hypothetical protein
MLHAATPTCVQADENANGVNDCYKCTNDDGVWWIFFGENGSPLTYFSGNKRVGPGYIGKYTNRINGQVVVNDIIAPADTFEDGELNDPHYGGLLAFGYHAATTDMPGGPKTIEPLFKTSVDNRRDGSMCVDQVTCYGVYMVDHTLWTGTDGLPHIDFTIYFRDDWQAPSLTVYYGYVIEPSDIKVWTNVANFGNHPYPFIKEPKFVAAVPVYNPSAATQTGGAYKGLTVFRSDSTTIRAWMLYNTDGTDYCNSMVNTCQLGFKKDAGINGMTADYNDCDDTVGAASCTGGNGTLGSRVRARYDLSATSTQNLNVVSEAWNGSNPVLFHDRGYGLDKWAEDALLATPLRDENFCQTQHPDGSTHFIRRWEIVNAPKNSTDGNGNDDYRASVLFHAWEGGAGYHDCYGGYRQLQDFTGKVYSNFFSISADVGWVL